MAQDLTSISAQRIYEHVRKLTEIGPREDGTTANHKAIDYVAGTLSSYGLDVQRQSLPCWVIEPIKSSLRVTGPPDAGIKCYHSNLTGVTGPEGVTGEVAFVGRAFEEDFEGRDVSGKIALAYQQYYWEGNDQPRKKMVRAAEHGAVALIFVMKRRDDLITCWGLGNEPGPIPFISVAYPHFLSLLEALKQGPVEAVIKVIGQPRRGESANIWTIIPGTELPEELIGYGSSHHETVPMCPGANDNAVAQAALLELACFFKDNPQKRSIILFSDGREEAGICGARAFVEAHRDWLTKSLKAMLMMDQVGGMQPLVCSGTTKWLEEMWIEEAKELGYALGLCTDPMVMTGPDSLGDALPFLEAGIPTVFAMGWPTDFFYHTEQDTLDKINANGVKAMTEITASLMMRLASQ